MLNNTTMYVALPVKSLREAMRFYGDTLGMHIVDENQNGVWYASGHSRFALYESNFAGTNQATAAILEVEDPEGTVHSLRARGVVFENYDDLPGAERKGDVHIIGSFKAAWFKDPFGNILCIGKHL